MRTASLTLLTAAVVGGALGLPTAQASAAPSRTFVVTVATPGALDPALSAAARIGTVEHVYDSALTGFAIRVPSQLAPVLRAIPGVAAVEADRVFRASAAQSRAAWGLDRIDQRALPLDATYRYGATGAGVTAYVVDTGIRTSHAEFGGRARNGIDTVDGDRIAQDCQGHGTHVAASVGGATYGVAKKATLVAVRVLDCKGSGATSDIVAGVDWMVRHHAAGVPAVANLSLGGGRSAALDAAVGRAVADGITVAVAAGNGDALGRPEDACTVSPARVADAITVGASDRQDRKAAFSNYGSCVDLDAPGVDIVSAGIAGDRTTAVMSGTSMAAPHVAGVAALLLQRTPRATPAQIGSAIKARATRGAVTGGTGGVLGLGARPATDLLYAGL